MVIAEHIINQAVIIEKFVGRFDQNARQDFKWRIDMAIQNGYRSVILNMTDVSFIDSSALGWLVLSQRRFQRLHGKLSIVVQQGFVRDILELSEISEWISIYSTEAEALQNLSPSSFLKTDQSLNV